MTDLEIPFERDRKGHYRFFEILPGALSYTVLLLPVILSLINPNIAVAAILFYLLIFFVRSVSYSARAIAGYRTMKQHMALNWRELCNDLEIGQISASAVNRPKWHGNNLARLQEMGTIIKPSELVHVVMIATVNESREVLEPTIQSVIDSDYDASNIILVFAYEGRAGKEAEDRVNELVALYKTKFRHMMAVKHPANIPGELIGKGGNITYAARELQKYLTAQKLDPAKVSVTTLDADNRPDKNYFAALTYLYCVVPDPIKASFQPLPMFTNNIWDAPSLMRVIATGNNLFYIVGSQRPHLARNFSAHAQSMRALIDMDFWSVRTIVEDGHHFWRSYFRYDGDYRVYPISIPIYQDAVLADGYIRTLKAQFIQLRRWTYGASDVAYIASKGFFTPNKVNKYDVTTKFLRLLEGHVTWATGTLIVYFAAFIPPLINPDSITSQLLPLTVSRLQRFGIAGLLISLYICLVTLPPRPARYKRHRSIFMLTQWLLLPVTSVAYGSLAAFNSQTRLMFKRYLSKFDVTEKAVVTDAGKTISTEANPE
ncbi:glycosyltransferase family 2 protein [Polaromonas sp.]|nr:glycosyltransferase family 2 protein [Candidatus Saccharibacteria bacterium]